MNTFTVKQRNHARFITHRFSISYLLKVRGAHYRKAMRILSKSITAVGNIWTGINVWRNQVVSMGPPLDPLKYGTPRKSLYFIGSETWKT